jgi:hypothetical protein
MGPDETTCLPRSGCKRTALEKKRLTCMALVVNPMPIAKPIKPRICSGNGTVVDQCSGPKLCCRPSEVRLTTVQKVRLQWLDATDDMLAESRAFLFDHGYEAGLNIRAYTSKSRDATRAKLGLAPLKERE